MHSRRHTRLWYWDRPQVRRRAGSSSMPDHAQRTRSLPQRWHPGHQPGQDRVRPVQAPQRQGPRATGLGRDPPDAPIVGHLVGSCLSPASNLVAVGRLSMSTATKFGERARVLGDHAGGSDWVASSHPDIPACTISRGTLVPPAPYAAPDFGGVPTRSRA